MPGHVTIVKTGLADRWHVVDASERRRAVERALSSGAIVRTPMDPLRRPPVDAD